MAKTIEIPIEETDSEITKRQMAINHAMQCQNEDDSEPKKIIAGDTNLEDKDPQVELTRDIISMAMAHGDFKNILPQVTTLDHPEQAINLSKATSLIEMMRACGMPKQVYDIMMGNTDATYACGIDGFLRLRMGVFYPGFTGFEMHPRRQLFGGLPHHQESAKKRGIKDRLLSVFG